MGLFKKKEEILDLRGTKKVISEFPVPVDMQKRIERDIAKFSVSKSIGTTIDTGSKEIADAVTLNKPKSSSSNGVGFFSGFFGGGSASSSSDDSNALSDEANTVSSNSENNSYSGYYANLNRTKSVATIKAKLEDLSTRISRVVDRLELLERKMERLEGR